MGESRYIIGIDLGTTNTAAAYVDTREEAPEIRAFGVPQLVRLGHVEQRPTLPSFLYLSSPGELPPGSLTLPWDSRPARAVGVLARDHGAKVPSKLVASAKSWLCHGGVDRTQPILPMGTGGAAEGPRVSPVEASAAYLSHLRDAWNSSIAKEDPSARLEAQQVLLTVPASFDPVARELTVQAGRMAGLEDVTLLEEPQAALYAWLSNQGDQWRKQVSAGDVLLVCDVGGGTTDFSLIVVSDEGGNLVLDRVAVGDHILLGGDNMDLALAHVVQQRLAEKGMRLDAWQSRELWYACRDAKEALLADGAPESHPVSVLGRGSRLIGGAIKADVGRDELARVVMEGFFPKCGAGDRPQRRPKVGLRELGLPYAADAGVTRHLAEFLGRHADAAGPVTAVLFNGGVFKAQPLRDRVAGVMDGWARERGADAVRVLGGTDLDLAVSWGAAYYGLVRRGRGIRIRGGTARSYYVGVESAMPAVPGLAPPLRALCVAPFGMEEGTEAQVQDREFGLVVGEPSEFRFLSSNVRTEDPVGTMVEVWGDEIAELAPLEAELSADEGEAGSVIPVTLQTKVTEVGTLEVWCVERDGERRWRLELNIREAAEE